MCYTCQMGRMHAFRRPGVTNHKYEPLDFISLMITLRGACGLIRVETRERTPCWEFWSPSMDKQWIASRIIHCDYDSVLLVGVVQGFITGRKLSLRVSAPYCHHQNGQIERAMQTTLDKTRTLLAASQAPLKYGLRADHGHLSHSENSQYP
jgi:hypothetical protein